MKEAFPLLSKSMSAEPSVTEREPEEATDTGCSSIRESPCTNSCLGKDTVGFGESHKSYQPANSDATQGNKMIACRGSRTAPILLYLNAF